MRGAPGERRHRVERCQTQGRPEDAAVRVDGGYVFADSIPDEHLRSMASRAQAVLDFRASERACDRVRAVLYAHGVFEGDADLLTSLVFDLVAVFDPPEQQLRDPNGGPGSDQPAAPGAS